MADVAHSFDGAEPWVPDQLIQVDGLTVVGRPMISLVPELIGESFDEITVIRDINLPDVISLNPGAIEWLSAQVRESVEGNIAIKDVLLQGRELSADEVLRIRAVHRGSMLRSELRWDGPDTLAGAQIAKLAHTHQHLLATHGDEARTLRFRARLQAMDLESILISYAATELIDPKVLDEKASLEVLCHSSRDMTSDVIVRLGLARAHLDELGDDGANPAYIDDDLWPIVQEAWHRDMLSARGVAAKWAEKVIADGRSGAYNWRR